MGECADEEVQREIERVPNFWPIANAQAEQDVAEDKFKFPNPGDPFPSLWIQQMREAHFTQEQIGNVIKHFGIIWCKNSVHVDAPIVASLQNLIRHTVEEEKKRPKLAREQRAVQREARRMDDAAFATQWGAWQAECTRRKEYLAALSVEWRKRISEREIAMAQWDSYVAEARDKFQTTRQIPPPPQPKKGS